MEKFPFNEWEINSILDLIIKNGISIIPDRIMEIPFADESDRKFFEAAKFCNAHLVTGNVKHYPNDALIMTAADFYDDYIMR